MLCDRIIGPYFFAEKTVTANTYLDMLMLQLPDGAIFQQDGAPNANMVFLEQFARWIGRRSVEKLLSSSLLSKNLKIRIYKTVMLPVVLYGCETWTLTLRDVQRLRVFENEVLRKIFGAKRDEVTGEWRKLHNAELHALYSSPDIIRNIKSRRLRWAGHVLRMGESRNAYRVLVGRPEGKRPLEMPRRRWEDNIKMDWREMGCDGYAYSISAGSAVDPKMIGTASETCVDAMCPVKTCNVPIIYFFPIKKKKEEGEEEEEEENSKK
ncbi:hypothetical protein ANN_07637 [Periplaneta americana]|uniref:Uncharacterized protein n=1 Tax=Periplaneta americana TaxID=6978 RepID=A0ABQ8SZ59_PERAM|nr:hypothetical protein ANN_07637 [Periplaneta americana]